MNSQQPDSPPVAVVVQRSDYINALVACFLGWTLDAFDFFVLVFTMPAIAKEFHTDIPAVAGTIAVTLAFRPVGAFIFGLLADRYGRRLPLMLDLVFYSVIEVLSGLAPNYSTFLVLRALFGIGMGGEWGVGASLVMEKVPPRWRGVLSGLLQEGYAVGYLLAACCYFTVFPRWGWRPMFFIGGLPALLALFVRYRVKESAVWQKTRQESWSGLGRAIVSNWKLFLYLTALMMMMNFASHGTQDMYPTFLKEQRGFAPRQVAIIAIIYNIGALLGGIVFGQLSDRFGRRRGMMTALLLAMVLVPLWAYAPGTGLLVVGAFLIQFMVQGAWGVIPAHITELSPDSVRGFLPGFAYQCGVLLAGSVAYIEAIFARHLNYATAMGLTALTVFAVGVVVIALGPERRGATFGATKGD
ncbi:MAG TPA: MFS transporter [Candidatus Acidoferrum sp.]|jgi:SHS family lactate transporter-like MFS transporter|nr:MFS transporter [Candidatus Acidoferrum sp.]